MRHRSNRSLNNRIEHDYRSIKQRYDPMRESFRVASRPGRPIPLAMQRRLFVPRWRSVIEEMQVASDTSSTRRITTPRRLCWSEI